MIALLQDMDNVMLILVCDPLIYFAFGLVIFVLNLQNGQVLFFGEIQITEGL